MEPASPPPRKPRASIGQVAATVFFGLLAIGRKNTWEKDGVTVTPVQIVVGALIGLAVVLFALITPVITVHPMRDLKTWKPRWEGIAARDTGERSGFGTTGTK